MRGETFGHFVFCSDLFNKAWTRAIFITKGEVGLNEKRNGETEVKRKCRRAVVRWDRLYSVSGMKSAATQLYIKRSSNILLTCVTIFTAKGGLGADAATICAVLVRNNNVGACGRR